MITIIQSQKRHATYWQTLPKRVFDTKPTIDHDGLMVVDPSKTYQTHLGFGGAFTEAASTLFAASPFQAEAINAYFSQAGLRYNLGRTVIHSCDFSKASRTYLKPGDTTLATFDCAEDDREIIPFLAQAQAASKGLWLLASPWSPPAFMKTNQHLYYGGSLKPDCYALWADYIVKYLQAMQKRGQRIHALTIQNEPEAIQTWESCHYTAAEEKAMVTVMYDALQAANLDVKIIIWDHNRDRVAHRAHAILHDTADKVWGVGHHWYVCEDAENLSVVHDLYPNHHILFTEGCVEFSHPKLNQGSEADNRWRHAEFYGRNIIKDSLNHTEGFIDWNLFLDEQGGPNHVNNFCEAPILINRQTGVLFKQPSYYYIGHFSRFIEPGAQRIHQSKTVSQDVYSTAYKNPDGTCVIVIQNEGWIKNIVVYVGGRPLNLSLPDHSITTLIIEADF